MTLFDEFCSEVGRRSGRRFAVSINSSLLIRRLAAEMDYNLIDPGSFANCFSARLSALYAGRTQTSKNLERLRERHAELLAVADEQEALLAHATPFTSTEVIERAQSKLSASLFLSTLAKSELEATELPDATGAAETLRSKSISDLNSWRDRLRLELERIRGEIGELERSGAPVNFDFPSTEVARLIEELMAVDKAVSDADACLKTIEEKGLESKLSPEARLARN
ncbi:MAG TPA: hypothetical protein VLJ61_14210, partial [Pyrinomonadaceae bacterium]|nr:hypothetical protein [Pyrinomonadaceae bacterium]